MARGHHDDGDPVVVGGLLLFRLRGVPVLLAPSWWIGSALITVLYAPIVERLLPQVTWTQGLLLALTFAVLLGVSVLLHELGHCVVALRMDIPVRKLRLFLLGGITETSRTPRRPREEGLVALAGPVVSIVLAGLFWIAFVFAPVPGAVWLLLLECAIANLAVAVFNLLPGLPLDGGRILRAGVWAGTGRRSVGTTIAVAGAGLVSTALAAWALAGLINASDDKWLRLGVCVVTVWFVVGGARDELAGERGNTWPDGLLLVEVARPVLQLPAESPVGDALAASAGRGVVLVRADGVAAGLLDEDAAQKLAVTVPSAPAERAAEPIRPETVLLDSDPGQEIIDRVRTTAAWQFLVVDADGRPVGVLRRQDLRESLRAAR